MQDKEGSLETRTTKAMIECNQVHHRVFDLMMSGLKLYRTQHHTLLFVSRNPAISQTRIANDMKKSPAAVAVTLKKLEADGYVSRLPDEKDGRFHQVSITEKGQALLECTRERFNRVEEAAFTGFSPEELQNFYEMLGRVTQNMRNLEREIKNERKASGALPACQTECEADGAAACQVNSQEDC